MLVALYIGKESMQRDQLISKQRGQIRDAYGLVVGAHVQSEEREPVALWCKQLYA